jgi:beta-glucanase (GH16 family)
MRLLRRTSRLVSLAVAVAALLPAGQAGAATGPYCGPTLLKSNGTPWVCTFDDEFAGSQLDWTKWTPITTAMTGLAYSNGCFVNSPNNLYVSNGYLYLVARKQRQFTCTAPWGSFSTRYSVGQVATTGHFSQTYGLFAVRAKFPAATVAGLQSSLWMWPQNLATTGLHGEIDIAEEYSAYSDRVIPYLHYAYDTSTTNTSTDTNVVTTSGCLISNVNAFHTYAVQWNSATISIYYDGKTCLVDNLEPSGTSPFDQPFFVELTQALGSGGNAFDAASTPLPASTVIDWVRAWK